MELEPSTNFVPEKDRRPFMPPPPPVALETVEDAHVPAPAGMEQELDAFYVGILEFERDAKADGIVYRAENFRLIVDVVEGPVQRDDFRMLGVIAKSLTATMAKLREAEIEFSSERGLAAGDERLVLTDPAGNWVRITATTRVM
jgi:hypothetical protein